MSRGAGRRTAAGLALAACVLGAGGCNNPNLSRRELVVHFDPSATVAEHDAARTACATAAPHVSPEPKPSPSTRAAQSPYDVRFRIDHASDRDENLLLQCLGRQRGVVGTDVPDAGG